MLARKYISKILLVFLFAFLVSQILVKNVIYPDEPALRPSFRASLAATWAKITSKKHPLPPPWPEVLPTVTPSRPSSPSLPSSTTTVPRKAPPPTSPTPSPTTIPSPTPSPQSTVAVSPSIEKVFREINEERKKVGVSALSLNPSLVKAAQSHAEDMARRNYFSHITPEGLTPAQRAVAAGYKTAMVAENIAYTASSPVPLWMGSEGHRKNMLGSLWKSAGLGYDKGRWVLLLGPI